MIGELVIEWVCRGLVILRGRVIRWLEFGRMCDLQS